MKTTVITGYITLDGKPNIRTHYEGYKAWQNTNYKVFILNGFWHLNNAVAYAEKHKLTVNIGIKHEVSGYKEWQCGVVKKWHLNTIKSAPQIVAITKDDHDSVAENYSRMAEQE